MEPRKKLLELSNLFTRRNGEYGTIYKTFGDVCMAFFPEGISLRTAEDFTRFSLFMHMMSKMRRYSQNWKKGHVDSLDDLAVYTTMLGDVDDSNTRHRDNGADQQESPEAVSTTSHNRSGDDQVQ